MADKQGTPLTSIAGFPLSIIRQLADVWITTAEEFYATAIQKNGTQGLAQHLHITESEVSDLMRLTAIVSSPILLFAEEIEHHGLGVLDEPDEEWTTTAPLPPQIDLHHRIGAVRSEDAN